MLPGLNEVLQATDGAGAALARRGDIAEKAEAHGRFIFECFDADGNLKWTETADNVVMTEGKNLAFDTFLAGSAYTVTGPYMGLISSVSFTSTAATDVGTQINGTNGWTEAGNSNAPTYTGNRKTCVWSGASGGSKSLSASLQFAITGNGTVEGAFILYGAAATHTVDDAHGTLWSGSVFTGGSRAVQNGDTLNVSYTTSM